MKFSQLMEMSKEEILNLLVQIAEDIKRASHREYIGLGWEYDPVDRQYTLKIRFRHVYLDVESYKKFIDAVYNICEKYGFYKDTVFIFFEYNHSTLEGYVDVEIEIREEDDQEDDTDDEGES